MRSKWCTAGVALAVAAAMAVTGLGMASASAASPVVGPEEAEVDAASVLTGVPLPADDPFYVAPAGFAGAAPGTILRSRQVSISTYGLPITDAENAYQLLIRTTNSVGVPVTAVTTVFVPLDPPSGPRDLMAFQVAIDSLGSECSPSDEMRMGVEKESTGESVGLSENWDTVITDFEGTQDAMFAGPMAGHAVLDGIRAAESFQPSGLDGSTRVVAWGYSGGGQATAWAAQLQPTYAPELDMVGYIAGDFPSDMTTLIRGGAGSPLLNGFIDGGAIGIERDYPILERDLNAAGLAQQQEMANECQGDIVSLNSNVNVDSLVKNGDVLTARGAPAVLRANTLGLEDAVPTVPVLLQQSTLDELIPASQGESLDKRWCASGGQIDFDLNDIPEHIVGDFVDIPGSVEWAQARFAGAPVTSNCP